MKWLPRRLRSLHSEPPRSDLLPGFVALGHWGPRGTTLDLRLELLVAQLSAELSECRWCIELGRHGWRKACLPAAQLDQLRNYRASPSFSEREAAALALAEAIARYTEGNPSAAHQALALARTSFTEDEVARLARLAAGEHFFDPTSGAVGEDVGTRTVSGGGNPATPWRSISAGISIRGWW